MKRGEIYFIKRGYPETGSEQRADRPAVIVSNNNNNNNNSEVVEVVYMTTKPKNDLPTHVFTRSALVPSTILCEQINSVSVSRIGEWIGTLTDSEMANLDNALAISLGLDFCRTCPADCRGVEPEKSEPPEEESEKLKEGENNTFQAGMELMKLHTERDLYKKFSEELVEILKTGRL